MYIEEINADRDKFLSNVASIVGSELKKIGVTLINVNVTDIEDNSGYIEAQRKDAPAHEVNEEKVRVAERDREGYIGESLAEKERRLKVRSYEAEAISGTSDAKRNSR